MRTLLTLIALAALAACSKPKEAETETVAPVQVTEVQRDSINRVVSADGILYPLDQANVMPKISAPVKEFKIKRGDHVAKDQLLATLENRDLEAAAAEAKQLYEQALASQRSTNGAQIPEDATKARQDVMSSKEALDATQKVYESRKQLFEQGALARRLVDEANVAYVQARSQYDVAMQHMQSLDRVGQPEQTKGAEAQAQAAKARYDAALAQLSYSEIRSPIAGVIADRPLYAGEMAAAGSPLVTVVNVSRVIARANIPVSQAASLKVGDTGTIAQTEGGNQVAGKVTVVSPAVDPNSTTVQVWVEADNPGEKLKPGATVRVSILAETISNAVIIPATALLPSDEGGVQVMVVGGDSVAHEKKVELGARDADKVQVVKGLDLGEKVITGGGVGLDDGAKVRIVRLRRRPTKTMTQSPQTSSGRQEMIDQPPTVEPQPTERAGADHWTARFGKSIIFVILTMIAGGIYLAFNIPIAVFPETNFPRIVVGVDNGVAPIDQMLVTVTRPIEQALNSVPGLERVQSITSRGSVEVDLFFSWKVDMFQTLELVNAALARVQSSLPPTAAVTSNRLTFAAFPILGYSLTSPSIPQTRLWEMATYEIKPRLNRLGGVSTVVVQGGQEPEFEIQPDPAKLLQTSVTVPTLLDAVRRSNMIDSPGLVETNHQLVLSLVTGQVHDAAGIANIVVKTTPAGLPVRIGDLGTVHASVKPVYTIVRGNGKPAVLININRQPDSNTVQVADEVHSEIDSIRKTLPQGVTIVPFYDQSDLVKESIKSVRDAILIGLLLAAIILVLFLRDWGSSIVAGLVIPATIAITFVALRVLGQSFNLMTLGGLAAAVGLVIDDAIVVVENIVMHRDGGQSRSEAIRSAMRELRVPLVGSTLTPIVVFLPLISITGVNGMFFRALAVTVGTALLTSLALALTWTPTLSHYFLRKPRQDAAHIGAGRARDSWARSMRLRPRAPSGFGTALGHGHLLRRPHRRVLLLLQRTRIRFIAGDGRGRLHPGLSLSRRLVSGRYGRPGKPGGINPA